MRLNAPEEDSMKQEAAMYVCKPCFIVAWHKVLSNSAKNSMEVSPLMTNQGVIKEGSCFKAKQKKIRKKNQ